MEFVYRRIAGIEPAAPGFSKVKIIPMPTKGLANIKAEFDSINGKIISGYSQSGEEIRFFASIPEGVEAEIYLPNEGLVAKGSGEFNFIRKWENLDIPTFTLENTVNEIFENPKALSAFNEAFDGAFNNEIGWMRRDGTLQSMADYFEKTNVMKRDEFEKNLNYANEIFEKLTSN